MDARLVFRAAMLVILLAGMTTAMLVMAERPADSDPVEQPRPESLEPSKALDDQERLVTMLVLFLPWEEAKPTPPPPKADPKSTGGDPNDPGNPNDPGSPGDPGNPGDPGSSSDPNDPTNSGKLGGPSGHHPEPATLISGILGAAFLALTGLRKRWWA
jgi:hypothetical protein